LRVQVDPGRHQQGEGERGRDRDLLVVAATRDGYVTAVNASLVGRARALAVLLGGQPIDAPEALQLGLVEIVVSTSKFDGRLRDLAGAIAEAPPAAVAGIKSSVNAVRPHRSPELADMTVEAFARTWSDPAHWQAVEKMEKRRRDKR